MKKALLILIAKTIGILLFYFIFIRIINHTNSIPKILSAGPHLPLATLLLVFIFVVTRIYIVLLPAFFFAHLLQDGFKHLQKKQ
jgi:uncharacterized membrane protein (DUF485 family)